MTDTKTRPPRRRTQNKTSALCLRCTVDERAQIERRAAAAGLPLSEFVRVSAQNVSIRARADLEAVQALAKTAGDLGRVGGLLKMWLVERRGDGVPAVEIDRLFSEIREIIDKLADKALSI